MPPKMVVALLDASLGAEERVYDARDTVHAVAGQSTIWSARSPGSAVVAAPTRKYARASRTHKMKGGLK